MSETKDEQVSTMATQKQLEKAYSLYLDVRSRCNNLSIVGVAESTNVGNIESFVEGLLIELLGCNTFSDLFVVERAHRSLTQRPVLGARPSPIIARLLSHRREYGIMVPDIHVDTEGCHVAAQCQAEHSAVLSVGIYSPSYADPQFYYTLQAELAQYGDLPQIWGGDFNCVMSPDLGCSRDLPDAPRRWPVPHRQ
ncbi:hypothetical protein NDU88_003938 [Pleurodeles waltl]|uniref:Uncharacterized protein n=1 Tax=Pleurodeles waltl TaxID=8319 RepID=A0AAV7PFA1_PLEWA|nr:hypothetical protein NDU88_003938 [Pleurodeles waltl]